MPINNTVFFVGLTRLVCIKVFYFYTFCWQALITLKMPIYISLKIMKNVRALDIILTTVWYEHNYLCKFVLGTKLHTLYKDVEY